LTKILFVCHGNICRSPMAEFVMKDMVEKAGRSADFEIASAATSSEELGNSVYPPAREKLWEHGISCKGKTARRIRQSDYDYYDMLIGMDEYNMRNMLRCFGEDKDGKLSMLLSHAGRYESVADPWYTGDFEQTWQDVYEGCFALMKKLCPHVELNLSDCREKEELYSVLRRAMLWQDFYGENLDALYDILTGMDYLGQEFSFVLPPENSALYNYARRVVDLFAEAGLRVTDIR